MTTIAIVNWNSGSWLRICVESLLATTANAEILIVDNASTDASLESIAGIGSGVRFICNNVNRGFAAAVNQAFRGTSTPYVLILNPDIRVLPGSLRLLEEFLDRHPRAGAVGGYVNDKYLPKRFPTAGSLVLENVGFRPRRKRLTDRSEPVAVDQPAAAALLVRRQAYEDVGGFDERYYPAWYEDVDFCRRIKAAGWEIYFAPKAEFLHGGGYSAENLGAAAFARAYYSNQLRYARKHLACTAVFAIRASIAAGALGRMITRPRQAFAYGKVLIGAIGKW